MAKEKKTTSIDMTSGSPYRLILSFTMPLLLGNKMCIRDSNKVSLFTRFIDLESGETQTRIINKNK